MCFTSELLFGHRKQAKAVTTLYRDQRVNHLRLLDLERANTTRILHPKEAFGSVYHHAESHSEVSQNPKRKSRDVTNSHASALIFSAGIEFGIRDTRSWNTRRWKRHAHIMQQDLGFFGWFFFPPNMNTEVAETFELHHPSESSLTCTTASSRACLCQKPMQKS